MTLFLPVPGQPGHHGDHQTEGMQSMQNHLKAYRLIYLGIVVTAAVYMPGIGMQTGALAEMGAKVDVGRFSTATAGEALPEGWEPLVFKNIKNHTHYTMAEADGTVAVKAESHSSASGLIRKIRIDPFEYPWVSWRWRVMNVLQKGDVTTKQGDDYPARLYITFEYDPAHLSFLDRTKYKAARFLYGEYPPTGAINYIWGSNAPAGLVTPNPYTERAMMIVVESGTANLNQWVQEKRNILEDYRQAFNSDPPAISGVAVMTDTDNTGESAIAYFGDIVFEKDQGK
jgi:hypothetical protein